MNISFAHTTNTSNLLEILLHSGKTKVYSVIHSNEDIAYKSELNSFLSYQPINKTAILVLKILWSCNSLNT